MLPVVQVPAAIAADLSRRDFTLNAMALRVDGEHFGEVLDPHGGRADLEAGVVRALHARSFQDDPTRMFRAVRYEQRLGFQIAPDTLDLIPGAWEALAALTGDRVRHEFELIFREPNAVGMLTRLQTLEILGHVHPALHWDGRAAERAAYLPELPHAEWNFATPLEPDAIYLTLLLSEASPDEVESALMRLNVGRAVGEAVRSALSLKIEGTRPSEIVACLDGLSELALAAAYALRPGWRSLIDQYLARWRHVRATLTGDDLIARGLKPGPDFKRILWELRAARMDGLVKSEAEELGLLNKVTG
jgi:tRNA nucleotidyltransferase (CCA-adding enzyme)